MEIAGYSYTFGPITGPRTLDHRKVICWYRDLGIKKIELFDPWITTDDEVEVIIDALGDADMIAFMCDVECHVVSRNPDVRKAGTEKFHQRLAVANRLGAKQALILPDFPAWDSELHAEECQEWLNTAIEQSLPVAKGLDIMPLVANLGFRGDIYGKADYVVEICKTFEPHVKTVYDVGNFVMAGEDPIAALEKVFPYTVHVHFKDWHILADEQSGASWLGFDRQWFQAISLGKGIVPLPEATARLKQLNYDGYVSPEYEGPEDPFETMGESIAYVRELLS